MGIDGRPVSKASIIALANGICKALDENDRARACNRLENTERRLEIVKLENKLRRLDPRVFQDHVEQGLTRFRSMGATESFLQRISTSFPYLAIAVCSSGFWFLPYSDEEEVVKEILDTPEDLLDEVNKKYSYDENEDTLTKKIAELWAISKDTSKKHEELVRRKQELDDALETVLRKASSLGIYLVVS